MNGESPLELLSLETEQMNPAILLAEEFMRRDAAELLSAEDMYRAEEVLKEGGMEIETIRRQIVAFERSPANSSTRVPMGF